MMHVDMVWKILTPHRGQKLASLLFLWHPVKVEKFLPGCCLWQELAAANPDTHTHRERAKKKGTKGGRERKMRGFQLPATDAPFLYYFGEKKSISPAIKFSPGSLNKFQVFFFPTWKKKKKKSLREAKKERSSNKGLSLSFSACQGNIIALLMSTGGGGAKLGKRGERGGGGGGGGGENFFLLFFSSISQEEVSTLLSSVVNIFFSPLFHRDFYYEVGGRAERMASTCEYCCPKSTSSKD